MFNIRRNQGVKEDLSINYCLDNDYMAKPNKDAIVISSAYGLLGALWAILSDKFLDNLLNDTNLYRQIQIYKDWIYVLITMGLIYILVQKQSNQLRSVVVKIRRVYKELESTYKELVASEEKSICQKRFYEDVINNAPVVISTWDKEGRIKSLNSFGQNLFGYSEDEIIDKKWIDISSSIENESLMLDAIKKIQEEGEIKNYESQIITKNKKEVNILWNNSILNSNGNCNKIISIGTDITKQKVLQKKLERRAYYDYLTTLPNRKLLENEIIRLIERKEPFAVAFMDMDNFKYINDMLGYDIGDELLNHIATKLNEIVKKPNIVAKLSGDEYAILFKNRVMKTKIKEEIDSVINYLGNIWRTKNYEFYLSFSIGISRYPDDGEDSNILFRNADIAMNKAKDTGKKKYLFYTPKFSNDNLQNIRMANKLQCAIENEEFILHYQPFFNLLTGEVKGLEALLRWRQSEGGFISPAEFISLAEKTGQIYDIEKWVFKTALMQKRKFEKEGKVELNISINLSSKTLMSDINFYELQRILESFEIDYSHITIEITETAIISNIELAVERLQKLKKFGLKIALDDFGTGYSSLAYLKVLPIDIVKLDRSFVSRIEEYSKDTLIINSLLSLAHNLKYRVIAEGIETKAQLEYLKIYKCDSGQGYLMSRPLCIEDIEEKLSKDFKYNPQIN